MFNLDISNAQWENIMSNFLNDIKNICPKISVDINHCKSYCIGDFIHDGCQVIIDKALNKAIAEIDFSLTKSELCSVVFFPGSVNAKCSAVANKILKFRARTFGDVSKIRVEPHLATVNPDFIITPESSWQEYSIHLKDFMATDDDWKDFHELAFVVDRRSASKFTMEISDIRIE